MVASRRMGPIVAVAVLVAGGVLTYALSAPSSWPGSVRAPKGYFFRFADAAGPPLPGAWGGATVFVETNLPERSSS
jgi:hypothetical protein